MPRAAELAREALEAGDEEGAYRIVTEAVAGLLGSGGRDLPAGVLDEPGSTGSAALDSTLAQAVAFSAPIGGYEAPAWAVAAAEPAANRA